MRKRDLIKNLLILILTAFVTNTAFGVEAELVLGTEAPLTVSIEKSASSVENASIDVSTGINTGTLLQSVFALQTNGTDNDYNFIMTSSVPIDGGIASGYASVGGRTALLFGNTTNLPTESDISDAKLGGRKNNNVIAYPITLLPTSPMTAQYYASYGSYKDCVVVKLNGATSGTVTQTVNSAPISGTYIIGQDTAGTYTTTVTLSAISK